MRSKLYSFTLLFITFTYTFQAQSPVFMTSVETEHGTSFTLNIKDVVLKNTQSRWTKYLKDETKVKPQVEGLNVQVYHANIAHIKADSMHVYSDLGITDSSVYIQARYSLNDGWLNKDTQEQNKLIESFMLRLGRDVYTEHYEKLITEEEKELQAKQRTELKTNREIANGEKQIVKSEVGIEKCHQEISNLELSRDDLADAIKTQKKKLGREKIGTDLYKAEKKHLRELEKSKKTSEKNIATQNKKILNYELTIKKIQTEISGNRERLVQLAEEIKVQYELLNNLRLRKNY